jgi:hypothetical protein
MTGIIDHDTEVRAALASAAGRALRAPSVFNTQPCDLAD